MGRLLVLAGAILIPLTALILLIKRRIRTMAERYQQTPGRFPSPKGVLMFLLPLPVLFAAVAALARGHLGGLLGNAAGYGLFLAGRTIIFGHDVAGWSTLAVALFFFSGVQLMSIGVLGEYLARVFNEVKGRPGYLIAEDLSIAAQAE